MHVYYRQQIPFTTLRYALSVMAFCFLPHLTSSPWWLSLLAVTAIGYRLVASYRNYPLLSWGSRLILVLVALILLAWHYGSIFTAGFFIGTLVTFFWLKVIELHKLRDLRVMILVSFFVIFTALVVHTKLWIWLYLIIAVIANVSLLLKLDVPTARLSQITRPSLKLMLLAIPVSFLLFFIFPRIANPLWQVNAPQEGEISFTEEISPGALSSLFPSNKTVMRITFKREQARPDMYWYGLFLTYYDGITWKANLFGDFNFHTLPLLTSKERADYEVLLEPHETKWLFYLKNPDSGWPKLQFSSSSGLTRFGGKEIFQRFAYALRTQKATYKPLSHLERNLNLQLPKNANPKLRAWANKEMAQAKSDTKTFINQVLLHIHNQPYWYRLKPKAIGQDKNQLDRFWFETREGYCEHYASAFAFILRAAEVPARVVVGYFGGEWNPAGNYLNVRQKDAHAWVEYWQNDIGWTRVDPTHYIAQKRIEDKILEQNQRESALYTNWEEYRTKIPWLAEFELQLASIKFFMERWLLFYNQERQQTLLEAFNLGAWNWKILLQVWFISIFVILFLGWLWAQRKRQRLDPLRKEYHRLQQELARFNVHTAPPSSLRKQWQELTQKNPNTAPLVNEYLSRYEALRLKKKDGDHPFNRKATQALLKSFRKKLKQLRLVGKS